jgi:Flp pilus assembly pilin Flp
MQNLFNRSVRDEQGRDLIEYVLLAGRISIASIVAITALWATRPPTGNVTALGEASKCAAR